MDPVVFVQWIFAGAIAAFAAFVLSAMIVGAYRAIRNGKGGGRDGFA